jgi:hypothetical protein
MSERRLGVIKAMRSSEDEAVWTGLSGKYPDRESDRAAVFGIYGRRSRYSDRSTLEGREHGKDKT